MALPIHGDALKMAPYRLEWRGNLTVHWLRIADLEEHPGDLKTLVKAHPDWKLWGGQWRLVCQHVVEARGLGA